MRHEARRKFRPENCKVRNRVQSLNIRLKLKVAGSCNIKHAHKNRQADLIYLDSGGFNITVVRPSFGAHVDRQAKSIIEGSSFGEDKIANSVKIKIFSTKGLKMLWHS